MEFGYAFMSPPPPTADKNGQGWATGGLRKGWAGARAGRGAARAGPPARSAGGGYSPPLEVLDNAVLAADCMADAAEAGDADPASAPFRFW